MSAIESEFEFWTDGFSYDLSILAKVVAILKVLYSVKANDTMGSIRKENVHNRCFLIIYINLIKN